MVPVVSIISGHGLAVTKQSSVAQSIVTVSACECCMVWFGLYFSTGGLACKLGTAHIKSNNQGMFQRGDQAAHRRVRLSKTYIHKVSC